MRLNPGLPAYHRRRSRVVSVGDVGIGGDNPIRVQSVTTAATADTPAIAAQIARLVEAGCEIVRLPVRTEAEAEDLPGIRRSLAASGMRVPLVADVHASPAAAMKAVEHVEKVRVNPGRFAERKALPVRDYTEGEYREELERLAAALSPLVRRAKQLGVALRIASCHGSLSDRILSRFGDCPEGMVASAIEFVRICEDHGHRDLVLSMKSSNPTVGLDAYRLLAARMKTLGMDYPLHLGVAAAGEGEDGRIKSALGIGVLLEEGLGDTVRVSLMGDPVAEVPIAHALVAPYNANIALAGAPSGSWTSLKLGLDDAVRSYPRSSSPVRVGLRELGGETTILVEAPLASPLTDLDALRAEIDAVAGPRVPEGSRAEILSVDLRAAGDLEAVGILRRGLPGTAPRAALSVRVAPQVRATLDSRSWDVLFDSADRVHVAIPGPLDAAGSALLDSLLARAASGDAALLVEGSSRRGAAADAVEVAVEAARRAAATGGPVCVAFDPGLDLTPLLGYRRLVARLTETLPGPIAVPVVLIDRPAVRGADDLLGPSAALGGLLCQGLGDSVHVDVGNASDASRLGFGILHAARVRLPARSAC